MKMKYRSIIIITIILLLLNNLLACKIKETKIIKIGIVIYRFDDNFMTMYRDEMADYFAELNAEKTGYEYEIVDSRYDQNLQNSQIDSFINHGIDVLIVNIVENNAASTVVNKAKNADIPIVLINREPENQEDMYIWPGKECYVGSDARDSGTYQGEIILELPDHGDLNDNGAIDYIMLIGDPENTDAQFRTEYSISSIENAGIKVNEVGSKICNWMADEAEPAVAQFLATNRKGTIDVIISNNDAMAIGALKALKDAGYEVGEDIYLVGVDAIPEAIIAIESGEMTGTVLNDHYNQARKAIDVAILLANGEEVVPYYWVNYRKILR